MATFPRREFILRNTQIVTTFNDNDHRTIVSKTYRDVMINAERHIPSTPNCKQYMTNTGVRQLIQEISSNLQQSINTTALYNTIEQKKQDHRHKFMMQNHLGLTDPQFIAIILWSSSEILTKQYHIDCDNNNEYKWILFNEALKNGIKKICQSVIINNGIDESENVFPSLPDELYRGTIRFNPKCSKWNLNTILSFTTSLFIAESFAARNVVDEEDLSKSCILCIKNVSECLLNGKLIAAPINWLSLHSHEQEWLILPSAQLFNVHKGNKNDIISCKSYKMMII